MKFKNFYFHIHIWTQVLPQLFERPSLKKKLPIFLITKVFKKIHSRSFSKRVRIVYKLNTYDP